MKNTIKVFIMLFILILMVGCGMQNSPSKKTQPQQQAKQSEKQVQIDILLAEKVKETAKAVKGVDDSTAVVINKDISTAIKVRGFNRLRLKSIKKEVHNKIKELSQNYTVHVTTDKKLFVQLQKIEKQIIQNQSLTDIEKKLNKINKDMQG